MPIFSWGCYPYTYQTLHIWNKSTLLGCFPKISCIKNHGEKFANSCQSTACQSVPRWHIFWVKQHRVLKWGGGKKVGSSATPPGFIKGSISVNHQKIEILPGPARMFLVSESVFMKRNEWTKWPRLLILSALVALD